MTSSEFLSIFEKHLLVGEPKRVEIIAELKTHISEGGIEQMGDPKSLARAYNITHLGSWRSVLWMFFAPFIAWFAIMILWGRLHNGYDPELTYSLSGAKVLWYHWGQLVLPIVVVLGLSVLVIRTLGKMVQPWGVFIALLVLTFGIGTALFTSIDYGSRSGQLDLNRLAIEPNLGSGQGPTFRDRQTGQPVSEPQFNRYVVRRSIVSSVLPAALMNFIIVGTFGAFSSVYLAATQRLRKKYDES